MYEGEFVKVLYDDGKRTRSLQGYFLGETPDGLFFRLRRPLGDEALIAKSAVRAVSPVHDDGVRA